MCILCYGISKIDTKTVLQVNLAIFDGTDCAHVGVANTDRDGYVSRRMVSRSYQGQDSNAKTGRHLKQNKARANDFQDRREEYPFPDASLLDLTYGNQHEAISAAVDSILKATQDNGLFETDTLYLRQAVTDFIDVFVYHSLPDH